MIFYRQLSAFVTNGFGMLDADSGKEVIQFVTSLQNNDGGFADRAGSSDLYYSLFAHFILKNTTQRDYQFQLKRFVSEKGKEKNMHLVDLCCLAILNKDLFANRLKGIRFLISALSNSYKKSYDGSLAYQYFLLLLTLDAYGFNNRLTRFFARRVYRKSEPIEGLPCSALAAQIVFKKQLGFNVLSDLSMLNSYFDEELGFAITPKAGIADLLSTAVALFALKISGSSVAIYAPACLHFIENNFVEGAFYSGDGDESRDVEYTFYGLLALGSLV